VAIICKELRAKCEELIQKIIFWCLVLYALSSMLVWVGCASVQQKENVLAVVNDEPITEGDLKYSLTIAHRREDLSSAGALDLSQFLQKLINDRLIIQEARRMGMEDYPEVQQAVEAYIVRESVVRLYDEEIVSKVTVSEDDLRNYYKRKYGKEPTDEGFKNSRTNLERAVRRQKEKERGDEYLKHLRELVTIQIDNDILKSVNLSEGSESEKLAQDESVLARVNGSSITVKDFIAMAKSYPKISKETILNNWIDQKVVDHEALSRHYETKTDLKNMVYRYRNQVLKNTFVRRVIIPQIALTDESLKKYYMSHQQTFTTPMRFKIQQITVKTIENAQDVVNSIKNGADFSWLAKNRSIDSVAQEGGNLGWVTMEEMPEPLKKVIETLNVGDLSPVLKINSFYRIVQLLGRKEGEVEEFDKVKNKVYKAAFEEQIDTLLNNYISQLKKDAVITINDQALRSLEEKIKK